MEESLRRWYVLEIEDIEDRLANVILKISISLRAKNQPFFCIKRQFLKRVNLPQLSSLYSNLPAVQDLTRP